MLNKKQLTEYFKPITPIATSLSQSGMIQHPVGCVFFDIYGTLLISASGDIRVTPKQIQPVKKLEKLIRKYQISKTPQSILQDLYSLIESNHQQLKQKGIDYPEVEIDRIWMDVLEQKDIEIIRKFAVEFELIVNPVYPMPHVKELLNELNKKKILMGIISNAQFFTPYLFLWLLGSLPEEMGFHPNFIFYSYQYGYAKPSGFLFDLAAEKLNHINLSTSEVLYVGNDMLNDIYPAKSRGFKTALFAGDKRSLRLRENDPCCSQLSADIIITDLIQLLDYIL